MVPVAMSLMAAPMDEPTCISPSASCGAAVLARWIGSMSMAIALPAVPEVFSNDPNALCNAMAPPTAAVMASAPCWTGAGRDENALTSVSNPCTRLRSTP